MTATCSRIDMVSGPACTQTISWVTALLKGSCFGWLKQLSEGADPQLRPATHIWHWKGLAVVRQSWGASPVSSQPAHRSVTLHFSPSCGFWLCCDALDALQPWRDISQILHAPHRRHCSYRAQIYGVKRVSSLCLRGIARLMWERSL